MCSRISQSFCRAVFSAAKKAFLYLLLHVLAKAFVEQCSQLKKSLSVLTASRISQSFSRTVFSAAKKPFCTYCFTHSGNVMLKSAFQVHTAKSSKKVSVSGNVMVKNVFEIFTVR